jgi:hypothetical protein
MRKYAQNGIWSCLLQRYIQEASYKIYFVFFFDFIQFIMKFGILNEFTEKLIQKNEIQKLDKW